MWNAITNDQLLFVERVLLVNDVSVPTDLLAEIESRGLMIGRDDYAQADLDLDGGF